MAALIATSSVPRVWTRLPGILLAAAAITFAVFYVMQGLIDSGRSALTEGYEGRVGSFVKLQRDDELQTRERKPEKPPEPPRQPPKPEIQQQQLSPDAPASIQLGDLAFQVDLNIEAGIAGGSGDGEYLPIVKVQPVYPMRALQRGIEGYVLLEFTVSKLGTVTDVKVLEASPPSIFDQAAIDAAMKFKYKPKMVNGQPMEVAGVRNIIRFKMDKGG